MRTLICCLCLLIPQFFFGQQKNYFQQRADFNILVALHPDSKTLDGTINIRYVNNSPDTLKFIWFHLWPNAYKDESTAFGEQLLQNGRTDFYFSDDDKRGYINRLNFQADGKDAFLEDHPLYIDVAKLTLPSPLPPGDSVELQTSFHEKIPYLWSRGGYTDDFFSITQWYPKPAVYDRNGWHPMPYLDQGEFYSEFGKYKVTISVPPNFTVAATGAETGQNTDGKIKSIVFEQDNIHDFAWFASPHLVVDSSEMKSIDGRTIHLYSYYQKDESSGWKQGLNLMKETIHKREAAIGPYPYSTARIVATPAPFSGGMEYPTITNIETNLEAGDLPGMIDHELGHNWFYGALASNERRYPWMDEGMNTFFTTKEKKDEPVNTSQKHSKELFANKFALDENNFLYRNAIAAKTDQPINTPSSEFSEKNYDLSAYYKTTLWLTQLEQFLGKDVFEKCMKEYYSQWKFRHPEPDDFKNIVAKVSGRNVDSLFHLLDTKGYLTPPPKKKFKVAPLFRFRHTDKYEYLFVSPALGYNYYDKLMAGIVIHNYTLPEPPFHFFISPMYSTGSKSFVGIGRAGYTHTSYGKIRKFEISLSGATFNMDAYTDSTGKKNFMKFSKIVPSIKLTFRNKNPRSQVDAFVQWKTFFINEQSIRFRYDSIIGGQVISYPDHSRYLNQLQFSYHDQRALYPFSALLKAEQSNDFLRLVFEGKYFFNYRKEGGLNARFFAGKFMYLGDKTIYKQFSTDRYHLNMTGANGEEDYTYSDYFIGRNEFDKLPSQQIMIRDGGFKVRTDLLSNKVGKTDNWLAALNLNTSIPKKINPLSILPIDVELKAFLDIGTYAEAWQKEAVTGKFLYDAGLQLSLVKDMINIYIPVLYSKVYSDYFKSTIPKDKRFWKNISFSIDIQNFRLKNFLSY